MNKKYINIDLDDERIKDLADVISNKTSKKIIDYLVDHESSETQISVDLKLPANTVNYNIKKLLQAGLIEKSKKWNWSVKGKKIPYYVIADKKIVISPKPLGNVKQMFLSLVATGFAALGIKYYTEQQFATRVALETSDNVGKVAVDAGNLGMTDAISAGSDVMAEATTETVMQTAQMPELWIWFLLGAVVLLVVYSILGKFKVFR